MSQIDKNHQVIRTLSQIDKNHQVPDESATGRGLQYCINQEQFLRVFLKNGDVPMDNNLAEQAIRPFTVGRKNWVCIATPKGAKASATLYSLVETAKVNNLQIQKEFRIGTQVKKSIIKVQ